jgi:hypothetical protein
VAAARHDDSGSAPEKDADASDEPAEQKSPPQAEDAAKKENPAKPAAKPHADDPMASKPADAPKPTDPTPAAPPMAATDMQAAADSPTGALWRSDDFCLVDNNLGVSMVSVSDGTSAPVEAKRSNIIPAQHGRWYAYSNYDAASNKTTISVIETRTLSVLHESSFDDVLPVVATSLREDRLILGLLGTSANAVQNYVIADIDTGKILKRLPAEGLVDWLPDGHYLRVEATGGRWIGAVDEDEHEIAALQFPEGHAMQFGFSISPDGNQLVVQLERRVGDTVNDDLWIVPMAGGQLERLTQTTRTSAAFWSPDGQYVAFNIDPDIYANCSPTSFSPDRLHSNAKIAYTKATSRNVQPADAFAFEHVATRSRLLAWTE